MCFTPLFWQDSWRKRKKGKDWGWCAANTVFGWNFLSLGSEQSFLSSVAVSGFKRGASWTPTESLLLHVVIKARQNQNIAFCFGSRRRGCGITWGSLLLQWHDVLHQARDGSVDVGVILEWEGRDKAWEMDDGSRDLWSCYLKHHYSFAFASSSIYPHCKC